MSFLVNPFRVAAPSVGTATDHFGNTGATRPWFGNAGGPAAFYDATGNKTWVAWESWNGTIRTVSVTTYDHATSLWGATRELAANVLTDDDHGVPSICMDDNGYVHCFHGPHNGDLLTNSTLAVRDPGQWPQQTTLTATNGYAYPRPVLVGSTLYLFLRDGTVVANDMKMMIRKTTSITAGVPVWGSATGLVDFGAATRTYGTIPVVTGTDIHFIATKADIGDTVRRNIYHFIYDTTNGSVKNASGGTVVASGSLPVLLASADANFRVFNSGATNVTDMPGFCLDSSNQPNIVYVDGTGTSFTAYHTAYVSGAWTGPTSIGTIPGTDHGEFTDSITLIALASGNLELWYPKDPGSYTFGGDMVRRLYTSGSWGSETTIRTAPTPALAIPMAVRNAHANLRVVFSEIAQDSLDSHAGGMKLYAYGDSGYIQRVTEAPTDLTLSSTTVYGSASAGTVIAQIKPTDGDAGDSWTYAITSDPDNKFAISGQDLQLNNTTSHPNSHGVTIRATDSFGLTKTKSFTVTTVSAPKSRTDTYYSNVLLTIDGERPGTGTDANIANVQLLIDAVS